jgi:hypothetical protein
MTGLRKFKALDHSRHNPAVGTFYGKEASIGRLLIVGMSHYGGEYVKHEGFTQAILSEVIERERRIPYFTKVAGLFRDPKRHPYSPEDFYPLVAFYNFLPEVYTVGQRVDEKQWLNRDTQRFFFRVVDSLKPQRILITGEQLWRVLPSRIPGPEGKRRVCEDGTGLDVQFGGIEAECCWYRVEGAEDCLVGAITHPSTRKFNQNRGDISNWIQKFMKWTKRVPSA